MPGRLRSKPFPIHQYSYHLTLSLVWVKHHDTNPKKVTKCYWLFRVVVASSRFWILKCQFQTVSIESLINVPCHVVQNIVPAVCVSNKIFTAVHARSLCCCQNTDKTHCSLVITTNISASQLDSNTTVYSNSTKKKRFPTYVRVSVLQTITSLEFHICQNSTLLLLLVFSPWAGLGRDQSSVRRLVWLWYAASWASS